MQFIFLFFRQTTLNGEPAEICFSVMKTDERSAQGENTVSLLMCTLFIFHTHLLQHVHMSSV